MHSFVALDVETANRSYASICAVGAARFERGQVVDRLYRLIDPVSEFETRNISVHGIQPRDVLGQPTFAEAALALERWINGSLVVHHGHFDRNAVQQACLRWHRRPPPWAWLDSAQVVRHAWPELHKKGYGLKNAAQRIGFDFDHHNPLSDAEAAGAVLMAAAQKLHLRNLASLDFALHRPPAAAQNYQLGLFADDDQRLSAHVVVFSPGSQLQSARPDIVESARRQGCVILGRSSKRTTLIVCGEGETRTIPPSSQSAQLISDAEFIALVERSLDRMR